MRIKTNELKEAISGTNPDSKIRFVRVQDDEIIELEIASIIVHEDMDVLICLK